MKNKEIKALVYAKATEIEQELRKLQRWDSVPLPDEKFNDMGAFGSNTMTFEQWLQFVLIPRIKEIAQGDEDLPSESMLAPYAIRVFDGDNETTNLHDLLYELDGLVNGEMKEGTTEGKFTQPSETVSLGDTKIPEVLYTLSEVLPQFQGEMLEDQLRTFDNFLSILSHDTHSGICELLLRASHQTMHVESKKRLEDAVRSIKEGNFIAKPYNHEETMRRHMEEHKKSFPKQE